ncbi:MAG: DUF433 domain-containing protein [Acidobacteria bacterium]|jgi:uncharacterized protein (DUF433 family)|nr:DUF433 domain-containing protein [Acidobacteriota bacterium]
MDTAVAYRYITTNKEILSGEPIIKGTRTSVRAIVENWRLGYAPEEIPLHLPHLTLAQVFEALSYYSDNQEEINAYIERNRVPKELIHPLVRDL